MVTGTGAGEEVRNGCARPGWWGLILVLVPVLVLALVLVPEPVPVPVLWVCGW